MKFVWVDKVSFRSGPAAKYAPALGGLVNLEVMPIRQSDGSYQYSSAVRGIRASTSKIHYHTEEEAKEVAEKILNVKLNQR